MHYTKCVCCIRRVFHVYGTLWRWSHVALNIVVHATLHKEPMLHVTGFPEGLSPLELGDVSSIVFKTCLDAILHCL